MEEENLEFEIVSRDEIIVAVSDKTVAVSTVLYQHGVERLDSWNRPGTPLSPTIWCEPTASVVATTLPEKLSRENCKLHRFYPHDDEWDDR